MSSSRQPTPPRLTEAALKAALSSSVTGRSIVGDLREEYLQRLKQQGAARAWRWYVRETWGVILRRVASRIANRVSRSAPLTATRGRPRFGADLQADLLYACRILAGNPRFAAVAVLTLALGTGAATAIFSVCHGVLLRPLPYPGPDRLVTLFSQEGWQYGTNRPEYFDIRQRQSTLQDIAIYALAEVSLRSEDEAAEATAAAVSGGFFAILAVPAMLGRTFGDEEDAPGKNDVIVLSHSFWQRSFGADSSAVGRTLSLQGTPVSVIGVMPEGFAFPGEATSAMQEAGANGVDFWIPLGLDAARPGGRGGHGLWSVARLRPGVPIEQGSQDMRRISLQMHQEHPDDYAQEYRSGWTLRLEPLDSSIVRDVRPALLVLLGAVGLLLLIACVNVALLLLARVSWRRQEIAMRAALGASRGRLIRQLLAESALLALLGGLTGVLLAFWGLGALLSLAPQNIPRLAEVGMDAQVLAFALAVSGLTGILFGLAPASYAVRRDLHTSLQQGRGPASVRERQWGNSLVVAEVALSLLLLIGAGLLGKSLLNLLSLDPGFRAEDVLTFRLQLPRGKYSGQAAVSFYEQLLEQVKSLPGVKEGGAISALPLGQDQSFALLAEGMAANNSAFSHGVVSLSGPRTVTPGYFRAMGIQLTEGRFLQESDRTDARKVALVSDDFARMAWPGEKSFLGKRIAPARRGEPDWHTVVGVTKDVREQAGKLSSERYKDAYFALAQWPRRDMAVTIKASVDPMSLVDPVRQTVASLDGSLALHDIRSMEDVVSKAVAQPRFNAVLMAVFAALALTLSAIGLYGVLSHSVSRRTREIGIRMALGARQSSLLSLVMRRAMSAVLIGLLLGLGAALALTRLLQSLLFEISPTDWPTYAAVAAALLLVAFLACCLPARKATKLDPTATLR